MSAVNEPLQAAPTPEVFACTLCPDGTTTEIHRVCADCITRTVAASREAQGLPEHVEDPTTLRQIATLMNPAVATPTSPRAPHLGSAAQRNTATPGSRLPDGDVGIGTTEPKTATRPAATGPAA